MKGQQKWGSVVKPFTLTKASLQLPAPTLQPAASTVKAAGGTRSSPADPPVLVLRPVAHPTVALASTPAHTPASAPISVQSPTPVPAQTAALAPAPSPARAPTPASTTTPNPAPASTSHQAASIATASDPQASLLHGAAPQSQSVSSLLGAPSPVASSGGQAVRARHRSGYHLQLPVAVPHAHPSLQQLPMPAGSPAQSPSLRPHPESPHAGQKRVEGLQEEHDEAMGVAAGLTSPPQEGGEKQQGVGATVPQEHPIPPLEQAPSPLPGAQQAQQGAGQGPTGVQKSGEGGRGGGCQDSAVQLGNPVGQLQGFVVQSRAIAAQARDSEAQSADAAAQLHCGETMGEGDGGPAEPSAVSHAQHGTHSRSGPQPKEGTVAGADSADLWRPKATQFSPFFSVQQGQPPQGNPSGRLAAMRGPPSGAHLSVSVVLELELMLTHLPRCADQAHWARPVT